MTDSLTVLDRPTILTAPVDTETIRVAWETARARYLHYVYTKHGTEPENLRPNTRATYTIALSQFFDGIEPEADSPVWPVTPYWRVTIGVAQEWKNVLGARGKLKNGQRSGLSAASIKLKLAALKGFYDYVMNVHEIPYNPHLHDVFIGDKLLYPSSDGRSVLLWDGRNPFNSKAVKRGKAGKAPVYLTTDEVAAIFGRINTKTVRGKRDLALYMALWSTGCRGSEILNLTWGSLIENHNGNFNFAFRGKSGKHDQVELHRTVYDLICNYLQAADRLDSIGPDDFIFMPVRVGMENRVHWLKKKRESGELDTRPKPLSNPTANRNLKIYARRAGVSAEKAHLHAFRHGKGRHMVVSMKQANGFVDITEINRVLRHANLDTTDHYTRLLTPAEDNYALNAIEAVMPRKKRDRKQKQIDKLEAEIERLRSELNAARNGASHAINS